MQNENKPISYYQWMLNMLEGAKKSIEIRETDRRWIIDNPSNLLIYKDNIVLDSIDAIKHISNGKKTKFVQHGKEYDSFYKIDKYRNAFVLIPLNEENKFYVLFWYIPKKV